MIFLICPDPQDDKATTDLTRHTIDQLAAHQASRTVLILCGSEPDGLLASKAEAAWKALKSDELLRFTSIELLRRHRGNSMSYCDIVDELFG